MFEDHEQNGKILKPPINYIFQKNGWKVEYRWLSHELYVVPEIIWLDLLASELGENDSSNIFTEISNIANKHVYPFGLLNSCFINLNEVAIKEIREKLTLMGYLSELELILSDFLNLYPNNPLNKVLNSNKLYAIGNINKVKNSLLALNDRISYRNTMALANVIYPAAISGIIRGMTTLANPSELLNYPNTEVSQKMASSVRASSKIIYNLLIKDHPSKWNKDFWHTNQKYSKWKIEESYVNV